MYDFLFDIKLAGNFGSPESLNFIVKLRPENVDKKEPPITIIG